MITILLIIGFSVIFFLGRRSTYAKPVSSDHWKPIEDLLPNLSRFRELDSDTYAKFIKNIELAKQEMSNPESSGLYLRRAVDDFSSLSGSLPSGDSTYHDEIADLAVNLAITGEKVLMEIAEESKQHFTPRLFNALID
jgi:hypothetical protein